MSLFISMNISGTVIVLFYLLFIVFNKNKFSFRWHMIYLKIALFFYLLPIGSVKYLLPEPIWSVISTFDESNTKVRKFSNMIQIPGPGESFYYLKKSMPILMSIWILAALLYLTYHFMQYLRFRRKILETSNLLTDRDAKEALKKFPELKNTYCRKKVKIYQNPYVEGPFTSGVFSPCIVLPPVEYIPEYSQDIYGHELYHIKNGDVFLKFICLVAIGLHWYNPFIYYLFYQICKNSEYYCDECVIRSMDREKRLEYAKLLVYMETKTERSPIFFSNGVSGKKKRVEKRLLHIINFEKKRVTKVSVTLLTGGCLMAAFISLITYQKTIQNNIDLSGDGEVILSADNAKKSDFEENGLGNYWPYDIMDTLTFDEYSQAFVDKNENVTYTKSLPFSEECSHQGIEGSYYIHEKNEDTSCQIICYEAKKCQECGSILYGVTRENKYFVCQHGTK